MRLGIGSVGKMCCQRKSSDVMTKYLVIFFNYFFCQIIIKHKILLALKAFCQHIKQTKTFFFFLMGFFLLFFVCFLSMVVFFPDVSFKFLSPVWHGKGLICCFQCQILLSLPNFKAPVLAPYKALCSNTC